MARSTSKFRLTASRGRVSAGRMPHRADCRFVAVAVLAGIIVGVHVRAGEIDAPRTVLPPQARLRADSGPDGGREHSQPEDARRLYVTGMVGSSLALHGVGDSPDMISGGLLAGGLPAGDAALGVDIPRGWGAVRLEFEGRSGIPSAGPSDAPRGDSWSVMANVWRDLPITDHLAGYVGGGLGAAGLPSAAGSRGGVAVQAGTGLSYAAHDRLTFDVGYRLHAATDGRALPGGGAAVASSELLLAVRIYDPFRGWAR